MKTLVEEALFLFDEQKYEGALELYKQVNVTLPENTDILQGIANACSD